MKKRIIAIFLIIISLFLLCSCEEERPKTLTSISTSFKVEGVKEADSVIISAKEKETEERVKIKLSPEEEKVIEMEPGTYFILDVSSGSKREEISLNEQYFTVSKGHKNISFSVKEEVVKNSLEWFFYNNSLYLLCLLGCAIVLGVHKWKEESRKRMR